MRHSKHYRIHTFFDKECWIVECGLIYVYRWKLFSNKEVRQAYFQTYDNVNRLVLVNCIIQLNCNMPYKEKNLKSGVIVMLFYCNIIPSIQQVLWCMTRQYSLPIFALQKWSQPSTILFILVHISFIKNGHKKVLTIFLAIKLCPITKHRFVGLRLQYHSKENYTSRPYFRLKPFKQR